jgi:glyoxylase-like metal-dependent hydrolase (beta-lactamase superfamily II)
MNPAGELYHLSSSLVVWQAYNPAVKVDCASTALGLPEGWVLIDPIPLTEDCLEELIAIRPLAGIVLTSGNHQRASLDFRARYCLKIFAPDTEDLIADVIMSPGDRLFNAIEILSVDGAGPGEMALLAEKTLVVGDSLINLGELALLPDKYCEKAKQMRLSLERLADHDFDTICFAHGLPLLQGRDRLKALLAEQS